MRPFCSRPVFISIHGYRTLLIYTLHIQPSIKNLVNSLYSNTPLKSKGVIENLRSCGKENSDYVILRLLKST